MQAFLYYRKSVRYYDMKYRFQENDCLDTFDCVLIAC